MTFRARSTKHMRNTIRLFEEIEGREFIIFDVETSGLNPKEDTIIELAAIKYRVNNKKLSIIDKKDIFIKPKQPLSDKVISIHHITNDFLSDKPSEDEIFDEIEQFFGYKPIIGGYNVSFDSSMLRELYLRHSKEFVTTVELDILEMSRDIISNKETQDYKLESIATLYGIEEGLSFHSAIDDVVATGRLLSVFYNEYKNKQQELFNQRLESVHVNYMYFWKGFNKNQTGLYLATNLGKIWLSTYSKSWQSTQVDLSKVDIDALEREVIKRTGLGFTDLAKLTETKYEKLKEEKGKWI